MINDVSEDCLIEYACFDKRVRGGSVGNKSFANTLSSVHVI